MIPSSGWRLMDFARESGGWGWSTGAEIRGKRTYPLVRFYRQDRREEPGADWIEVIFYPRTGRIRIAEVRGWLVPGSPEDKALGPGYKMLDLTSSVRAVRSWLAGRLPGTPPQEQETGNE